jgi:hypothetical protein
MRTFEARDGGERRRGFSWHGTRSQPHRETGDRNSAVGRRSVSGKCGTPDAVKQFNSTPPVYERVLFLQSLPSAQSGVHRWSGVALLCHCGGFDRNGGAPVFGAALEAVAPPPASGNSPARFVPLRHRPSNSPCHSPAVTETPAENSAPLVYRRTEQRPVSRRRKAGKRSALPGFLTGIGGSLA